MIPVWVVVVVALAFFALGLWQQSLLVDVGFWRDQAEAAREQCEKQRAVLEDCYHVVESLNDEEVRSAFQSKWFREYLSRKQP